MDPHGVGRGGTAVERREERCEVLCVRKEEGESERVSSHTQ